MDLQALQMAREDYKDYLDKFKPFEFGEELLRYNEGTDSYDVISEKPSELIQATNIETGNVEFVPESVIRAEIEAQAADPNFQPKYVAEKKVTDIVEAYNTQNKRFEFISQEALTQDGLDRQFLVKREFKKAKLILYSRVLQD